MNLKIKSHEYIITKDDVFMDNGSCVQLLSQSKERCEWGRKPTPVLSKRAVKEISKFKRIAIEHSYTQNVQVFKLDL